MTPQDTPIRRKKKVAWGITGAGDKLAETIKTMIRIKRRYEKRVDIAVYVSKAGEQVLKYYRLTKTLRENFNVQVEIDANTPFLAGQLQTGKFEFLLIAPVTSNTVAKISLGIADTLITNAAIMALKGFTPVYIIPTDHKEGITTTQLPNGKYSKIRIREEDAGNVEKLIMMRGVHILKNPTDINQTFKNHFEKEST